MKFLLYKESYLKRLIKDAKLHHAKQKKLVDSRLDLGVEETEHEYLGYLQGRLYMLQLLYREAFVTTRTKLKEGLDLS